MNLDSFRQISIQWNNDSIHIYKIFFHRFYSFILTISLRNGLDFSKKNLRGVKLFLNLKKYIILLTYWLWNEISHLLEE